VMDRLLMPIISMIDYLNACSYQPNSATQYTASHHVH
jgi:hypothetical protein